MSKENIHIDCHKITCITVCQKRACVMLCVKYALVCIPTVLLIPAAETR